MSENKHTKEELKELQALPLELKIKKTEQRIREWVNHYGVNGVYVSFSGGKDSTVLLHIIRSMYPDVKAVFSNTGLEFPEIVRFINTFNNVDIIKPKMPFVQVIKKYGYPLISKEVAECVYGARKYLKSITDELPPPPKENTNIGLINYADLINTQKRGGVTPYKDSEQLPESSLLKILLMQDYTKTIDNLRVQRLMGINTMDGKYTPNEMENIPSNVNNRSMFSCERYQFLLDAPFEVSNQCCNVMKKSIMKTYQKENNRVPITGQMASESRLRTQVWLNQGCNAFNSKKPISNPMSFWTENDCLLYIYIHRNEMIRWRNKEFHEKYGFYPEECENPFSIDSPIAPIYGKIITDDEESGQMNLNDFIKCELFDLGRPKVHTTGLARSGCMYCLFGAHHECCKEESRIQAILDYSNPKIADWMLRGGHFRESDGMWEPYQGAGVAFILEWCRIHGNLDYWYPNREYYLSQLPNECKEYLK